MVLIFSLSSPYYLTLTNFKGIFNNLAVYGILSAGITIVMIGGGFDLSIGSITGFVGIVSAVLMMGDAGLATPLIFLIAIAMGSALGLINGLIITKVGINPIITTLGTLAIIRGVCYFWAKLNPRIYNPFIQGLGRGFIGGIVPYTTVYIIVFFIILALILKFTRFGRNLYTIGGNEGLARIGRYPGRQDQDPKLCHKRLFLLPGSTCAHIAAWLGQARIWLRAQNLRY
jgi:ribose transport system permease protein